MRMLLSVLLVLAVFTPLMLVSLLFAEAHAPAMDRLTLALPMGWRSAVAAIAVQNAGFDDASVPKLQRVVKLDPRNAIARVRICTAAADKSASTALEDCRLAVELDAADQWTFNALGRAQEQAGDPCTAEDTFTQASSRAGGHSSLILRNMGRAAYNCGRIAYSIAELLAAEDIDAKSVAADAPDDDDLDDDKANLKLDREWLTLAYTASKQPAAAVASCTRAHPEFKTCSCRLEAAGPACSGASNTPASR